MKTHLSGNGFNYALVGIRRADTEAHADRLRYLLQMTDPLQLRLGVTQEDDVHLAARHGTLLDALAQCETTLMALECSPESGDEGESCDDYPKLMWLPYGCTRALKGQVVVFPDRADASSAVAA